MTSFLYCCKLFSDSKRLEKWIKCGEGKAWHMRVVPDILAMHIDMLNVRWSERLATMFQKGAHFAFQYFKDTFLGDIYRSPLQITKSIITWRNISKHKMRSTSLFKVIGADTVDYTSQADDPLSIHVIALFTYPNRRVRVHVTVLLSSTSTNVIVTMATLFGVPVVNSTGS